MKDDTIVAVATPPGEGGIGIVRLSGPEAYKILTLIARDKKGGKLKNLQSHILRLCRIVDLEEKAIDEALVTIMRQPRSYTGEDVVEIHCHGGSLPLRRVMELVMTKGGRLADPGEFTKRAFLNGRIDLTQAEAVIDLIRAKSDSSLRAANQQLQGELYRKLHDVRRQLVRVMAYVEANIDFPDEELDKISVDEVIKKVNDGKEQLDRLVASAEKGIIIREGVSTVIIGKPNVGKSSILNRLLAQDRAIVTDIPGTTRDVIEENVNIGGVTLRLVDTAGIRETVDVVERLGVEKTKKWLQEAELILLVLDGQQGVEEDDKLLFDLVRDRRVIVLINKIDIGRPLVSPKIVEGWCGNAPLIEVSAKNGFGFDFLEKTIAESILGGQGEERKSCSGFTEDEILVTRMRHKRNLLEASSNLEEVITAINQGLPEDFWSIDLRGALDKLGEITGEVASEEILETIFKEFCIGK